jgi:peptidase inhibitor family I36
MSTIRNRLVRACLAIGGSITMVLALTGTASAESTPRNGKCELGEFCLYWSLAYGGSISDFNGSVSAYGSTQPTCYEFKGPGNGQYTCVLNNAGSAWNHTTGHTVVVHYNGGSVTLGAGQRAVLGNRNTSHQFFAN